MRNHRKILSLHEKSSTECGWCDRLYGSTIRFVESSWYHNESKLR